jgi:microcystin-dependent protein
MALPFVGEIRLFAGNFAPAGWMFCNGAQVPISENETLFQLIGTTYGGDGQSSFALPDLRGRVPIHQGSGPGLSGRIVGETGGSEMVTLTPPQIPQHTHTLRASSALSNGSAGGGGALAATAVNIYGSGDPTTLVATQAVASIGGSQPHQNMAPFVGINYIISLFGIFPSPS